LLGLVRPRRCSVLFLFSFLGLSIGRAQTDAVLSAPPSFEQLVAQGRAAEAAFQPERALICFREALQQRPNDPRIMQAISKQLSDELDHVADRSRRLSIEHDALEVAERAARLAPKDSLCLVAVAVCEGKLARDADLRERVAAARAVKQWAEAALQADPKSEWAEHVLGVWNLEMTQVGGAKRALARMFFGELPEGSLTEAVAHLRRAVELGPSVPLHHLALGDAYSKSGDKTDARAEWARGLALPSRDLPDETAKSAVRLVMAKTD
jgi:Flp pilus assembly protein TadD